MQDGVSDVAQFVHAPAVEQCRKLQHRDPLVALNVVCGQSVSFPQSFKQDGICGVRRVKRKGLGTLVEHLNMRAVFVLVPG